MDEMASHLTFNSLAHRLAHWLQAAQVPWLQNTWHEVFLVMCLVFCKCGAVYLTKLSLVLSVCSLFRCNFANLNHVAKFFLDSISLINPFK